MMHLKNITAGNPKTKEQYQLTKQFNIKWLYSEDGKNWYEEQKNFQPDTLKMVYDHNGVIICIEKDVSAINPEGASVVELPDITANRRADISGKWMFKDGVVVKRTLAGLAAARARGRTGGRRPKLTKEQHEQIARLIKNGHDRKQLAIIYGIGISTIYRYHPVGDIQAEETTRQTQENENR
ncbi:helix-turn-helix domain-containing protein [Escherichia coli]|nr:helix-turn-helix domain-containing protein [Escherichia coli]